MCLKHILVVFIVYVGRKIFSVSCLGVVPLSCIKGCCMQELVTLNQNDNIGLSVIILNQQLFKAP